MEIQKNPNEKDPKKEIVKSESGDNVNPSTAEEYAAAIKKLKETTVEREKYDKLHAEHSALIKKYAEGKTDEVDIDTSKEKTVDEIKEEILKNKDLSNLDYVKNALSLRKQMLENGKPDPFAPNSRLKATTEAELNAAKKVADILEECVNESNGSNDLFNAALQRRMSH